MYSSAYSTGQALRACLNIIDAYLYGAGDLLIGSLINPTLQDDPSKIKLGKEVKARFLKQTPALAMLLDDIQKAVSELCSGIITPADFCKKVDAAAEKAAKAAK